MSKYLGNIVGFSTIQPSAEIAAGGAIGVYNIAQQFYYKIKNLWPGYLPGSGNATGAYFADAEATSYNSLDAVDGSARYAMVFHYSPNTQDTGCREVVFVGNYSAPQINSAINYMTGPDIPGPFAPKVTDYEAYSIFRYSSSSSGPTTPMAFTRSDDNHTIHARAGGGYVRGTLSSGTWRDVSETFRVVISRVFMNGGVTGFLKSTGAFANDNDTRNNVLLLGGSDSPTINDPISAGRAGGVQGQNGVPCRYLGGAGCCNGGGGGGGRQNSPGPAGGGNVNGSSGNGFSGGSGTGGSGADGWYGGGSGGRDDGQCGGTGAGGSGSSRLDPSMSGVNTNFTLDNLNEPSTYWYLGCPLFQNHSVVLQKNKP